ncbi:MAG TPA: Crp/Fnr family transcriptional regulator [Stellaceae bacterium]|nr:Crp/Fnr family transcriptional regulator [Stellaceae bacterium]
MASAIGYRGKNRLLAALPADDFDRYFSALERITLTLRSVIQGAAQPVKHVYFVEDGVSSVLTIMDDGSAVEVGMIGSEGMIGIAALLDGGSAPPQVIVQIPGTVLRMPIALCKCAFDESAGVRTVMLRFAADMLGLSTQTAACNRLHSIEQRCARWLLMAYDRVGSETMPMTHEFLAYMLGVRRAGVTTTAQELQRSGLIRYRQGQIVITDLEGLKALACECRRLDHERLNRML